MMLGKFISRISALGGIAAVAITVGAAPAGAATGPTDWRLAAFGAEDPNVALTDVVALGRRDAWAFGMAFTSDRGPEPVARRWNGRSWTAVALPSGLNRGISAADASSSRNVWAFGGGDPAGGEAFALRWDGRRWQVAGRWPGGTYIADTEVLGPRDVWLFGDGYIGESIGTWHFDGRTWSRVETPVGHLQEASAVASDDIWAIGGSPVHLYGDLLARWDGRTWTEVSVPGPPNTDDHWVRFSGIHAESSRDVWIVGEEYRQDGDSGTYAPFMLHFDGRAWQRIVPPSHPLPYGFLDVTSDGRGGVWVIPALPDEPAELLHYRDGRWTVTQLEQPNGQRATVSDVTAVPRARFAWAVGYINASETGEPGWGIWANGPAPR
ncbi:hypothetical protein Arub01_16480 [Actinomadura rubrobrunea]|uniref:Uncharacterized protein n=1 Tax=Actinomadura rubrobrunea TaxID=115335 RepID=A0A9W6PRU5_9ACTN|nr:hypothetical protein [Actinomadura rubrobrunea]GLW63404.1 hypothetical protein Arub01_16480 [Actinomadura rubrobrunea]